MPLGQTFQLFSKIKACELKYTVNKNVANSDLVEQIFKIIDEQNESANLPTNYWQSCH